MAKEKERLQAQTGGRLDVRADSRDEHIVEDLLADLSLFRDRVDAKKLASHPGAVVLRFYKKGDTICRQAEPGWTAFSILTREDVLALRKAQIEATENVLKMDSSLGKLEASSWQTLTRQMTGREASTAQTLAQFEKWVKLQETDVSKFKTDRQKEKHETDLKEVREALEHSAPDFLAASLEQQKERLAQAKEDADRSKRLAGLLRRSIPPTRLEGAQQERRDLQRSLDNPSNVQASAQVFLQFRPSDASQRMRGIKAEPKPDPLTRFIAKIKSAFTTQAPPPRRRYVTSFIPIDGPVDLSYEQPVADMYEGELFGEMSCLNRTPRSATIKAAQDCYMVEFLRPVLEMLQKSDAFNQMMLEKYKERVLSTHLGEIPLFRGISTQAMDRLREATTIAYFDPGQTIFKEGETAEDMFIIRVGHVKVFRVTDGVTTVLSYPGRGDLIGEMGLIEQKPRNATCQAYDHPEEAKGSKSKIGRVELLKISKALFDEVCALEPKVARRVADIIEERRKEEKKLEERVVAITGPVDELGLLQGRKLMLIDLERCTRCDECVRACASAHEDGRSRLVREGPRFGNFLVPASCRQCRDPVCMIGCPVGSIHKGEFGEVVIEDWCIGCGICAEQCPYGSIHMHERAPEEIPEVGRDQVEDKPMAVVCDQCSSLKDGVPSCVYACPHDAAGRVDAWSFFSDAENRFRSLGKLTYEHLGQDRKTAAGGAERC